VLGLAPVAVYAENAQSTVAVRCSIRRCPAMLRTAMKGHARVYTGRRSLGGILLDRSLRVLKTELWW
jgi:hypothetical protein